MTGSKPALQKATIIEMAKDQSDDLHDQAELIEDAISIAIIVGEDEAVLAEYQRKLRDIEVLEEIRDSDTMDVLDGDGQMVQVAMDPMLRIKAIDLRNKITAVAQRKKPAVSAEIAGTVQGRLITARESLPVPEADAK